MTGYLKAFFGLVVMGSMWGYKIYLNWLPFIVAILSDKMNGRTGEDRIIRSILLADDLKCNSELGGYFRTTLSSEMGALQNRGSDGGTKTALAVNWGFRNTIGQLNHCRASIEKEDIHRFSGQRMVIGFILWFISNFVAVYLAALLLNRLNIT